MKIVNVFYFNTSIGPMAIAWNDNKILAIQLPEKNKKTLGEKIHSRLPDEKLHWNKEAPFFVRDTAERIRAHLSGRPQNFTLDALALDGVSPFHKKVYSAAIKIPPGQVSTYGKLAQIAGSPRAARAVGQAMARNPFPLVIPCHRVLGSTGKLVGFSAAGGTNTKKAILEIESRSP